MMMNNFIADRWFYYQNKISFPYVRKIGVKGDTIKFEEGEEQQFRQFLRTNRAAYLWSDCEDLHVISNLYQMQIMVITTKGDEDTHPTVHRIGPDPELNNYKLIPEGAMEEMKLLHYDEQHYNLIISKDSDLAKTGALSEFLEIENEMLLDDENENVTLEEETLEEAYKQSQKTVENLKRRVKALEKELNEKSSELHEAIDVIENVHEFQSVKSKKRIQVAEEKKEFKCEKCNSKYTNQTALTKHRSLSHENDQQNQDILRELKETQKRKDNIEKEYKICEEDLRIKTEQLEKCKIEIKDLRTIVDLRKKLEEKENETSDIVMEDEVKIPNKVKSKPVNYVPCSFCDYKGENKIELRRHMNTKHTDELRVKENIKDEEFNCMDCDFQTTSEAYLKNHINIKHTIICRICEMEFKDKRNLLQHRKKEHYSSVAPCKKYAENNCPYKNETCFWNHTKTSESENIQCFICGKTFRNKIEIMKHRKLEHIEFFKVCNKYQEGKCGFQESFCFFKHDKKEQIDVEPVEDMDVVTETEAVVAESVFHKTPIKLKPPLKN